jgi:L-lactate dehydrogenase complex protein LldF
MSHLKRKFLKQSELKAFDLQHRNTINYNIGKYYEAQQKGKEKYADFQSIRKYASSVKADAVNHLGEYLQQFVENFRANGGKVFFAEEPETVNRYVKDIVDRIGADYVVKSKSMATEEINLNDFLEKNDIKVWETDLGEFIVQIAGEKPYHIVTPAMHKSLQDVIDLYHSVFGTSNDMTAAELTEFTRNFLREKFFNAKVGITGANFLVADIGAIALTENEGNAFMSFSFPKVHIVIVPIEKILPSVKDISFFWQLLSYRGTGQSITAYDSLVLAPKKESDADGPEEMIVIIYDNNRSKILQNDNYKEVLKCIKCGACFNYCPVYKNIGGHTYNTVYGGPVGSILTPLLFGLKDYGHLPFACTLCMKCEEVCPVEIKLTELILQLRNDYVKKQVKFSENIAMTVVKSFTLSRAKMDLFSYKTKRIAVKLSGSVLYGKKRQLPDFQKSFAKSFK